MSRRNEVRKRNLQMVNEHFELCFNKDSAAS